MAVPFDVMFPDKAIEMKRMVFDYVKVLRRSHSNSTIMPDVISNGLEKLTLQIDETGFPIAPRPQSWTKIKKDNLESIYRLYMTRHYRKLHCMSCEVDSVVLKLF